ncbi:MAG: formyltransferase family protein, partial [Acidobacteriota bacterium]|nr:formyltransferase family protein [Acidobacteriota bacterium]
PMGCINVHFSLLPKYRGAAPVNWAVARCEPKTGVTTMKMDAGLDTGDILLAAETDIAPTETAPELMERLSLLGAELLSETLETYPAIQPRRQDDSASSLAPLFTKSDGIIDWTKDADAISCQIRGFQPFPRSFSEVSGRTITFWKAEPAEGTAGCSCGEVIEAAGDEILICCGSGTILRVTELQAPGKPRMSARDFLNGDGLRKGDVFVSE